MKRTAIRVLESGGCLRTRRHTRAEHCGKKPESLIHHFLIAPEELPVITLPDL
jgi:hypothetical protein